MISDLEKYNALTVTVEQIWKRAINIKLFSIWFETSNMLDNFSNNFRCNKKVREELNDLSKLAELIGRIEIEKLKKEKS